MIKVVEGKMGQGMSYIQTQCYICPKCNDDHHPSEDCEEYRKKQEAFRKREHERKFSHTNPDQID